MSGILSRTVYYEFDQRNGYKIYRFHDWNTVITGVGEMVEPSQMVPRPIEGGQLDWEDTAIKIDVMSNMSVGNPHLTNDPDEGWLHGYNLMPRKGR